MSELDFEIRHRGLFPVCGVATPSVSRDRKWSEPMSEERV